VLRTRPGRVGRGSQAASLDGPRAARRGIGAALVAVILVFGLVAGLRLWNLLSPPETYWDEHYYALDAYAYLGGVPPLLSRPDVPTISGEDSWGQPPMGKWMIATGEDVVGGTPLGSRLPSALFGMAGVLFVFLLGMELWDSAAWSTLAAFLVATDGLHVVQSRIAMLDVFLTTFVTAGVYFLVRDLRRMQGLRPARRDSAWVRRWFASRDRLLAGLSLGAAVATKWSGLGALVLAATLTMWREARGDREHAASRRRTILLAFVAVPVAVYLLSYTEFFVEHPFDVAGFLRLQVHMFTAQLHVAPLSQNSSSWSWPLLLHPVRYWPEPGSGFPLTSGSILAVGNVALFWGFLVALPLLLWRCVARRAPDLRIVMGFYAALLLPWLVVPRPQFIVYVLPCVPFMALAVAGLLRDLASRAARRAVVAGLVVAQSVAAVAFVPVWLDLPVSAAWLHHLRLLPGWP
jgi:dolichyl-phosphate-mannose-protein mannosyltransferase